MPRDMTGTGRYPPQPRYQPFAFYTAVRVGDPEMLSKIMDVDPYFVTQDNGAGAPIHFAVTYRQLDMVHHLLNNGAEVNQRDSQGFTPLHRAAYLAHLDGYLEIYEYLLSRGADPSIRTKDYDPYLNPGCKTPVEVAADDPEVRLKLKALEKRYQNVEKVREPHEDIGDWWALYDYGLEAIKQWAKDYKHPYPEVIRREKEAELKKKAKEERRARRAEAIEAIAQGASSADVLAMISDQGPDLDTPIAFLFPGQGSQAVGMLKESCELPAVKKMLAKAKEVLGYDLMELCNQGPKEKLDNTVFSQPALFVAGLAAVERLRSQDPGTVSRCSAAAGLSLGEYTALVFAGVLSFEDGLKVVKVRAESMAAAAKEGSRPHGMLSVVGLMDAEVDKVCKEVKEQSEPGTVCQLANMLFPQGRVISGHHDALDKAQQKALASGALKATKLAVSGAFHTPLMKSARENLMKVLAEVNFKEPRIPVYSNVTAMPFTSAQDIPAMLGRQLVEPVLWEKTLVSLIQAGKTQMYELGPGAQIKAMVKRLDAKVWGQFTNIAA